MLFGGGSEICFATQEAVCNATPQYCEQVNIGGTQTLIRALQRISISMNATNRVPWLIMGSSQVSFNSGHEYFSEGAHLLILCFLAGVFI